MSDVALLITSSIIAGIGIVFYFSKRSTGLFILLVIQEFERGQQHATQSFTDEVRENMAGLLREEITKELEVRAYLVSPYFQEKARKNLYPVLLSEAKVVAEREVC